MILFDGGIDVARECYLFRRIEEFEGDVCLVRRCRHVFDQRIGVPEFLAKDAVEDVEVVGLVLLRL
jgi:hypothetical protein